MAGRGGRGHGEAWREMGVEMQGIARHPLPAPTSPPSRGSERRAAIAHTGCGLCYPRGLRRASRPKGRISFPDKHTVAWCGGAGRRAAPLGCQLAGQARRMGLHNSLLMGLRLWATLSLPPHGPHLRGAAVWRGGGANGLEKGGARRRPLAEGARAPTRRAVQAEAAGRGWGGAAGCMRASRRWHGGRRHPVIIHRDEH